MPIRIDFSEVYAYDTLETGINVPIKLAYGGDEVDFPAKLDTGSSHCIFQYKHGARLGLTVENGSPLSFSTATGPFRAFGHELTVSVMGVETYSMVYFAADEYFSRNVLGRQGWLDRVKLGLIDYEGKLFLSAYEEEWKS